MAPHRLQNYIINALEDHKICKFRIPKESSPFTKKDPFNESILNFLDTTVSSNLLDIVSDVILKYKEDIAKAYGNEFDQNVLNELIDSKFEQFNTLTQKIISKEIGDVVLPVFKTSILHTNKSSKLEKTANIDCIDFDLLTLKSECIKMDLVEYIKFYEELEKLKSSKKEFQSDYNSFNDNNENSEQKIDNENNNSEFIIDRNNDNEDVLINQEDVENLVVDDDSDNQIEDVEQIHESIQKYNIIF